MMDGADAALAEENLESESHATAYAERNVPEETGPSPADVNEEKMDVESESIPAEETAKETPPDGKRKNGAVPKGHRASLDPKPSDRERPRAVAKEGKEPQEPSVLQAAREREAEEKLDAKVSPTRAAKAAAKRSRKGKRARNANLSELAANRLN
ncbi:MAG: hypothetical protein AAF191_03020 [Verrucomicrobiota bacterium]